MLMHLLSHLMHTKRTKFVIYTVAFSWCLNSIRTSFYDLFADMSPITKKFLVIYRCSWSLIWVTCDVEDSNYMPSDVVGVYNAYYFLETGNRRLVGAIGLDIIFMSRMNAYLRESLNSKSSQGSPALSGAFKLRFQCVQCIVIKSYSHCKIVYFIVTFILLCYLLWEIVCKCV